ncbi:MAG: ATP-binding protein, partial [Desulfosalsimonas sp.]
MEIISGYRLTEKISESRFSELFRAERVNDGLRAVIRFLYAPALSAADAARFRKEFENIKNLEIEGIVTLYELLEYEDGFALVMEDFRGSSLKSRIDPAGMDFGEALDIGARLAATLGRIHEKGLVHKAVKPSNILIKETPDSCRITDFGDLSLIAKEHEDIYAPGRISGTLPYMAPEQTGRMNRRVDRRTDLYCLGSVLYEMLTGVAVFVSDDPMEIIHSHIARPPAAPSEVKHGIPGALSDVVMKLLFKAPEDRYQSTYGLLADLEHCRRMLAEKGMIEPFKLARKDMFLDFDTPGRLVGRENETASLKKCFDRVLEFRRPGVSILTGPEGIGKSALAETVCSSVALERGYFIAGRYDQFRGEVPYSAIIQAFMSLVSRLLAEGPERIESWKKRISEALGSSGRVITEVIPNLELIVGRQPEVPELGPEAARNRFVHVFINFVSTFASSANPLILFLDDLQWADRESLGFLARLVEGMDKGCMWLVLAYRNTESGGAEQLVSTIREIENTIENVTRVDLGALDREAVCSIISGMLKNGRDAVAPLAAVVHQKTGGSPFFVSQFLKNLYEKDYLNFDPSRGWFWDEEQIFGLEVTDNVVELMTGKLAGLSEETRDILKTGACIGNRFGLETLAAVRRMSMDEVTDAVEPALKAGYLHYMG